MTPINVTNETFREEVLLCEKPVLVDFWAPWCGPCRMVGPILDQIADERADIKVVKINVDEEAELAKQFQIMSIPTLLIVKDGEVIQRASGAMPKAQINALI